jgi:cystathionine beta-lyase/cystathionine gamma-synthase
MTIDAKDNLGFSTRAIHAGESKDRSTGALNTPIYMTSTFAFDSAAEKEAAVDSALEWQPEAYFYSRTGNPTTYALECKVASLEGAEDAVVSSAGMAAVSGALFSLLNAGDHCVAATDMFIITRFLIDDVLKSKGVDITHVDVSDFAAVRAAMQPNTKVLFIESLSNPHMELADIATLADIAHEAKVMLIVDNTFLSPYLLRPLEFGADLVVHSGTKYLGGHGDALAGTTAGRKDLIDGVRYQLDSFGGAASPFNSWLILRGIRTLAMRMKVHSSNALAVAQYLEAQDGVEWVGYVGLQSHPQHDLASKMLHHGFGGMMSMRLAGGIEAMERFVSALQISSIAVSLGDVHSLAYPMPKRGNLIRLSVGCEDVDDLVADYARGINAALN